ncbi:MAG: hypothetical protein M1830_001672 [Pleopsidium flavum]|nr:MAG: hypothetical protein M1830_001672 [Pleopsidium flavum]
MEISTLSEPDCSKSEADDLVGATLLYTATGDHPVKKIRNVDWEDYVSNRSARSHGFPKLGTLVEMKQRNITWVESNDSGSGPDGRGWAVRWRLFLENWDPEQKFTLADLGHRLRQCQPETSRKNYDQILLVYKTPGRCLARNQAESLSAVVTSRSARSLTAAGADPFRDATPTSSTMTNSILFDVVLISRLPPGIKTQALRHLPLAELTAKPSFCFLWVEDFAEIELCCGILEGWGFRPAEDILVYNESVFRAGLGFREKRRGGGSEARQETSGVSDGCRFNFRDSSEPDALSSLGLDQADYNSMIPHELRQGLESNPVSSKLPAFQQQTQYCHSDKVALSVPVPHVFTRGAHHCLMGIKGTVKRSIDGHVIHCNVDTDVLLSNASAGTPNELIDLVENLAQGRRRLHLFGDDTSRRRGWVTMGPDVSDSNLDIQAWLNGMQEGHLIKATKAIESLRPKSPQESFSGPTDWVPPTPVIFESLLSRRRVIPSLKTDVSSPSLQDPIFQNSLLNKSPQGVSGAPRTTHISPMNGSEVTQTGNMSASFPFDGVSSQLQERSFIHTVSELKLGPQNHSNVYFSPRQGQVGRNSHVRPKQMLAATKLPTPGLSHMSASSYESHPTLPPCVQRGFPALHPDYEDGRQPGQRILSELSHHTLGTSWQGPNHRGAISTSSARLRQKGSSQELPIGDVPRTFETGDGYSDHPEMIATQLIVPQPIGALPMYSQVHFGTFSWSHSVHSRNHHEPKPSARHHLMSKSPSPSLVCGDLLPTGRGARLLQVASCGRAVQVAEEGPSDFEALTARALQEAVAMPFYPPPTDWEPRKHLHGFYYEIAMRFHDCYGKILEAHGIFDPISFLDEWLDHVRQIFSDFEKQWEARESGSTIGIRVASRGRNAPIAAQALAQALDAPTSPPLAGWKPGRPLHPYYGSLLNRFDDALRTMLADTDHPLCSDKETLSWMIDVQACKIIQGMREVWMAKSALWLPSNAPSFNVFHMATSEQMG